MSEIGCLTHSSQARGGGENAGSHQPVGNAILREVGQSESPSTARSGGCTASAAVAYRSSPEGADFVRPAGAGRRLGKTRGLAEQGRKGVAPAAPICGKIPVRDSSSDGRFAL